jgi:hypothetical protein
MDAISSEALEGLNAAVASLLPDVSDLSVQLIPSVAPTHIKPTGFGGFVGINEDPKGEIIGRRLDATALVTARADNTTVLNDAVTRVSHAFLGADRATLLEEGFLRVVLDDMGPQTVSDSGSSSVVERDLTFKVLYEFLKRPEEPEDVILEIPTNLDTA